MSFFGLTAFGPESIIKSSLVNSGCFTLYFDDDYKRGYSEVIKKHGSCGIADIKEMMTYTMGFPPLEEEVETFVKFSGKTELGSQFSWDEIKSTLDKIRAYQNEQAKKSVNYSSYGLMKVDEYHHLRKGDIPNVYFRTPVCRGMQYGFYQFKDDHDLNNIKHPKVKCNETKYAEALVMSGFGH